jgi:hypothetical protein
LERQLSHVFAHIQNLDLNNDKIIITWHDFKKGETGMWRGKEKEGVMVGEYDQSTFYIYV